MNADAQTLLLREIEKTGKLEPQVSNVAIIDPQLTSLRWDFRDYRQVEVSSALAENYAPEIIISAALDEQKTAQSYQGIRIVTPGSVPWDKILPINLLRAAASRSLPAENFEYYLCIRQDLMTGALP